ncbi:hypothetical protein NPIL_272491 [Nephila pilipes]|uniref:Uncharacterized protein n=1 Tax=Nephila pilipes TaxID=299642 RepID=A0A8X6UQ02_NEPPI|nr:hypothetical protein NPIL_272491 [Nephila pilipes]
MVITDQDRNNETCLIRTLMEENYKEAAEKICDYQKYSIPFTCNSKEYKEEKEKLNPEINKYLALNQDLKKELEETKCPLQCASHKDISDIRNLIIENPYIPVPNINSQKKKHFK